MKLCYTKNNVVLAIFECHNYRHGIRSFSNDIWILTCFTLHVSKKSMLWSCHNGGPIVTAILCWDLVRINADRLQNSWNYSKCIQHVFRWHLQQNCALREREGEPTMDSRRTHINRTNWCHNSNYMYMYWWLALFMSQLYEYRTSSIATHSRKTLAMSMQLNSI